MKFNLFHKHNWKLLDKTILPSGYEQLCESRLKSLNFASFDIKLFKKTVIHLLQCEICGKMKRVKTTSLD